MHHCMMCLSLETIGFVENTPIDCARMPMDFDGCLQLNCTEKPGWRFSMLTKYGYMMSNQFCMKENKIQFLITLNFWMEGRLEKIPRNSILYKIRLRKFICYACIIISRTAAIHIICLCHIFSL